MSKGVQLLVIHYVVSLTIAITSLFDGKMKIYKIIK